MSKDNDTVSTPDEKRRFDYWIYDNYGDTNGRSASADTFSQFAESVKRLRYGRWINPSTGVDAKRTGALIGLPKVAATEARGKENVKPASWACIDLDGVNQKFIDALTADAFPKYLCAVWRTHSWSEDDPRHRVLFAFSRVPDTLEDWKASVLAFYTELNRAAESRGIGMELNDKSCSSPAQMQVSTPTGRDICVYSGRAFDPIKAPSEPARRDTEPARPVLGAYNADGDAYAQKVMSREVDALAGTSTGGRNQTLNAVAYRLGRFVGAGRLEEHQVRKALLSACQANGLLKDDGASQVNKTIESGLSKGMQTPCYDGMERTDRAPWSGGYVAEKSRAASVDREPTNATPADPDCGQYDNDIGACPPPHPSVEQSAEPQSVARRERAKTFVRQYQSAYDQLDEINAARGKRLERISTGIAAVDGILGGGIREVGLYLLGARSALGKSAFCQQIADHIAKTHPVLYYSLEMSKSELITRSYVRLARHRAQYIDGKPLDDRNVENILAANPLDDRLARVRETYLSFAQNMLYREPEDFGGVGALPNVESIVADVREWRERFSDEPFPVVFIDYLQLLRNEGEKASIDANSRLSLISRKLKVLSNECPVIVVSSISRSAYFDVPSLDSFKSCGDIEYSANVALMLSPAAFSYSDASDIQKNRAVWDSIKNDEERVLALDVVKGRSIRLGRCYLRYAGRSYYYEGLSDLEAAQYEAAKSKPVQDDESAPVRRATAPKRRSPFSL